jgi:hypothetical protein
MQQILAMIRALRGRPLPVAADSVGVRPVEWAHLQAHVSQLKSPIGWVS